MAASARPRGPRLRGLPAGLLSAVVVAVLISPSSPVSASGEALTQSPHAVAPDRIALRALEVNGQQVSTGTLTYHDDNLCLVQEDSLRPLLAKTDLPQQAIDDEAFLHLAPPARCEPDDATGVLRLQVPASWLKEQALRLSSRGTPDPLPLLLGTTIEDPDARIQSLSATHIDLIANRHSLQWGLGAAHQGLQLFVAGGQSSQQSQPHKATLDWIWPSGAALRLGDQVGRQGPEQQPRGLRGLSLTNRLQVLRPSGLGQGQVALDAPARLQFFDTQGQPLFSTGLLPAGRYRLEGLGAPTLPGLLAVRVEGVSGQTETILLPWVASPLLLPPGRRQWDVWVGNTDEANLQSEGPPPEKRNALAFSGFWAQGWNDNETLRLGLGHEPDFTQAYLGVASQRWQRVLVSADLGLTCHTQRCLATGGLDISGQPTTGLQWSAGMRRQIQHTKDAARLAEPMPDPQTSAGSRPIHTLRLSLSQRLGPGTAVTSQLSLGAGRLALLGLQQRINARTSLQTSLRYGTAGPGANRQTTAFISLHIALPDRPTIHPGQTRLTDDAGPINQTPSYSSRRRLSAGLQSGGGGNSNVSSASLSYQQALGNTAFAPQIGLTKATGTNARQEIRLQQAAGWGDLSLQARQPQGQPTSVDLSLASRVWLTPKGVHLGPVGDHNLVIHTLGHPDLRLQLGRQTATTNAQGIAAFGRTPAWTEAQFRLDAQSMPFDLRWKTSQVRLPTAARRAYWIDQTQESISVPEFRLKLSARGLGRLQRLETHSGASVAFTPEGYIDMQSITQLPLIAFTREGERFMCHQILPDHADPRASQDPAEDVIIWVGCPGLTPDPVPAPPQIREALSEALPPPG